MTNLRDRLVDYLEPVDQDRRVVVDPSTCRAVMTPRVAMAVYIVIVILALGAIVVAVWISAPQVLIPAVQNVTAAESTPETTEAPAEICGGPGQEINPQVQAEPLVVSVVGSVVNPGVVEMPTGARAVEAINHADGLLPGVNSASVNLTALLVDGQQIVVGAEALPVGTAEGGANVSDGSGAGAAGVVGPGGSDGRININTASVTQLKELPGIGSVTVTKTVNFCEKNETFTSIDALEEVPGIGPVEVEALRDAVII